MPLTLPEPDISVIKNKKQIVLDLKKISPNIIHSDDEIKPYETDGLSVYRQKPIAVKYLDIAIKIKLKLFREELVLDCPVVPYLWLIAFY